MSIGLIDLAVSFLLVSGHPTPGVLSLHHLRLSLFSTSGWKTQASAPPLLFPSHFHLGLLADFSRVPRSWNLKHSSPTKLGNQKFSLTSYSRSQFLEDEEVPGNSREHLHCEHISLLKDRTGTQTEMQVAFLRLLSSKVCLAIELCLYLLIPTAQHRARPATCVQKMFTECVLTLATCEFA